jgi:photosystem II stability/assembly factor-like uncharacterized protein
MPTQLRRDVRAAFDAEFEPSPQLAQWVFLAAAPKPSHRQLLNRFAAAVAVIAIVASAGYYAYRYGIPGVSPVSPAADDGQALSLGTLVSGTKGWIVRRGAVSTRGQTGTPAAVFQTTDGGANWTERLRFKGQYDSMIFSPDGSKGVVWGMDDTAPSCNGPAPQCAPPVRPALVYRTADGGRTWLKMPTPGESYVTGAFRSPEEGWLLTEVTGFGNLNAQHTTDGGATWQAVGQASFDPYKSFGFTFGTASRSLVFADSQHGWLIPSTYTDATTPQLLATRDGGRTWQGLSLPLPPSVTGQVAANAPTIFGDGTGVLPVTVRTAAQKPQGPEPPSTVYVYTTADGGLTWGVPHPLFPTGSAQARETVVGIGGIWDFMDAKHWWVTNQTGTGGGPWAPRPHLLVTADGGQTWKTYDNSPNISDLVFVSPTIGWAEDQTPSLFAGNINGLIHTTDGGAHWTRVLVPTIS